MAVLLNNSNNYKTTRQNITCLERKNTNIMNTNEKVQSNNEETHTPVKKRTGRKPFDTVNGEKRTEKLMMYLTPETITRLRAWCDLKGISAVSYITALIEADLDSKADTINSFLEMRQKL